MSGGGTVTTVGVGTRVSVGWGVAEARAGVGGTAVSVGVGWANAGVGTTGVEAAPGAQAARRDKSTARLSSGRKCAGKRMEYLL